MIRPDRRQPFGLDSLLEVDMQAAACSIANYAARI